MNVKPRGKEKPNRKPEIEIVDRKAGSVLYLEHGIPSELVRWHHHEEIELHLIVATTGKMFVGDYIGSFSPGNLVMTGPHLPHNWVTHIEEMRPVPIRDRVILFSMKTFLQSAEIFPEIKEVETIFRKCRYGIEFVGTDLKSVEKDFIKVRDSAGLKKLSHFFFLLMRLAKWKRYRLLNTLRVESSADEELLGKINIVVDYLSRNYQEQVKLKDLADLLKMNPSYFSRFFHKATGNRFTDFLNRMRISRACELLDRTDRFVSEIGYEVGYESLSNFNRMFRKFKKTNPVNYRHDVRQRFSRV